MELYQAEMKIWSNLDKDAQRKTPPPKHRQVIVQDSTIEAIQLVLNDTHRGVLSVQDELSGWIGSMEKYSAGKGSQADRGFWLQAFNGGDYTVNRVSRGVTHLPNLSVGLVGGIQPAVMRSMANDTADDGLIQRFLPVTLKSASTGSDLPNGGEVAAYNALVERLLRLIPSLNDNPTPITFTAEAQMVRQRLEREHNELAKALEIVSPKLAAHFGKYDGIFARLCLIWHCVESEGCCPGREVSADVAMRVSAAGIWRRRISASTARRPRPKRPRRPSMKIWHEVGKIWNSKGRGTPLFSQKRWFGCLISTPTPMAIT